MLWVKALLRLAKILFILIAGLSLAVLLLEAILRANPRLLVRGMGLDEPVDPPLTTSEFDVRVADADELYWRPDLIQPVAGAQNSLEAHVVYTTDEYGFRNPAPLPEKVDLAVLGRSYSLGAQNPQPWPELVAEGSGWKVLNLSQPGADIFNKERYFKNYAAPRSPRWVVIEVEPGLDIIGADAQQSWLAERVLTPVLRHFFFPAVPAAPSGGYRYPLTVQIPGRTLRLTCCINYMDSYSLSPQQLRQSRDWAVYSGALRELIGEAKQAGSCVALLYAPLKAEVYLPLARDPEQLAPTVQGTFALAPGADGRIARTDRPLTVQDVLAGLDSGAAALQDFAAENQIVSINPTARFRAAVLAGQDPYMQVDSHWNSNGHAIIAALVEQTLAQARCP